MTSRPRQRGGKPSSKVKRTPLFVPMSSHADIFVGTHGGGKLYNPTYFDNVSFPYFGLFLLLRLILTRPASRKRETPQSELHPNCLKSRLILWLGVAGLCVEDPRYSEIAFSGRRRLSPFFFVFVFTSRPQYFTASLIFTHFQRRHCGGMTLYPKHSRFQRRAINRLGSGANEINAIARVRQNQRL